MQHALENGCKASELLEPIRYYFKLDGISYLHCEWETEQQMIHRFGKLRVQRKINSWKRTREEYENKCGLLWGGERREPFDPSFSEVDRVINCIEVEWIKKYYVKWIGLSYSCCTYETKEDVDDAAFKNGMYGWYKIRDDSIKIDENENSNSNNSNNGNNYTSTSNHQPAQNEADAKIKQELSDGGITPDEAMVCFIYKNYEFFYQNFEVTD